MLHAVCSICSVQYEVCRRMLCADDVCSMKCAVCGVLHSEVYLYRGTWSKYACLFQLPCAAILILVPQWCHYRSAWRQQLVLQPTLVRRLQPAYVLLLAHLGTTNYVALTIIHPTNRKKKYERFFLLDECLAYTRSSERCSNRGRVCVWFLATNNYMGFLTSWILHKCITMHYMININVCLEWAVRCDVSPCARTANM